MYSETSLQCLKTKELLLSQRGYTFWLTGFSGAGKTTLARELEKYLVTRGRFVILLDGDELREGLNQDLGFSESDRFENLKRAAFICQLLNKNGTIVLASFISPLEKMRLMVKDIVGEDKFRLIFVNCPLDICEQRDVKGLYARARKGLSHQFTGISAAFEIPSQSHMEIKTDQVSLAAATKMAGDFILKEVSI